MQLITFIKENLNLSFRLRLLFILFCNYSRIEFCSILPVITILMSHADAGSVISTNIRMLIAIGELFVAQIAGPAGFASALPWSFTRSVHTSGV